MFKEDLGYKVDLMGGKNSKYWGYQYINYDIVAQNGISDIVENFNKHFGNNTVAQIVVDNPRAEFLQQVTDALKNGGTITIRGQMSNPFFNKIWKGTGTGLGAFDEVSGSRKTGLSNEGYNDSNGTS
jgi:hypothetical protein